MIPEVTGKLAPLQPYVLLWTSLSASAEHYAGLALKFMSEEAGADELSWLQKGHEQVADALDGAGMVNWRGSPAIRFPGDFSSLDSRAALVGRLLTATERAVAVLNAQWCWEAGRDTPEGAAPSGDWFPTSFGPGERASAALDTVAVTCSTPLSTATTAKSQARRSSSSPDEAACRRLAGSQRFVSCCALRIWGHRKGSGRACSREQENGRYRADLVDANARRCRWT